MVQNKNILPQGWTIKTLGEIGIFLKGKGITKAEIVETGKPCIRYGEIYSVYNYFVEKFNSFIDETSSKTSEPIFKNDLLFAGSGETLTDIGKCVAYIKEEEAYAGGDIVILRPNSEDAHYLGYLFNADEFKKKTYKLGQGHSVVHIYSSSLKNVKVTLPPLPEQQKIAKILATWDKTIQLQKQLINNKKQYKKTVMKRLLIGDVRFKGFSEEWKELRLGNVCDILKGNGLSKDKIETNGKYKCVLYGELFTKYNEVIKEVFSKTNIKENKISETGDILMPSSTTTKGIDLAKAVSLNESGVIIGGDITILRFDKKFIFPQFMSYYLSNVKNYEISRFAQGITIIHLYGKDLKKLKLKIPCKKEQLRIYEFIDSIDVEINILISELLLFQKQKQGLMQQLLTGKIRVKN